MHRSDPVTALTPEERSVLERIYYCADNDYGQVDVIMRAAGLIWTCTQEIENCPVKCGYTNFIDRETCGDCGSPRPKETT